MNSDFLFRSMLKPSDVRGVWCWGRRNIVQWNILPSTSLAWSYFWCVLMLIIFYISYIHLTLKYIEQESICSLSINGKSILFLGKNYELLENQSVYSIQSTDFSKNTLLQVLEPRFWKTNSRPKPFEESGSADRVCCSNLPKVIL